MKITHSAAPEMASPYRYLNVRFIDIISIFVAPTPLDNSVPEVALWMSQI